MKIKDAFIVARSLFHDIASLLTILAITFNEAITSITNYFI